MAMYVYKFGGTSVGSTERIQAVAEKVKKAHDKGHQIVVVVSAMSGETNRLTTLAKAIQEQPNSREMDVLLSTGEQVTIALLCMALEACGCVAHSYTGSQVRILTDSSHTKARIREIDDASIRKDLEQGKIVVVAGFQGVNEHGKITTLGRGGSDTTAVALAAVLKADECHIYTDVDGVYTTDPRVEPRASKLDTITFEEMLEMASLGSKVLQIRSVEFAGKYNVPLRVLSSFQEGPGTLITVDDEVDMEKPVISGIAFTRDEAKITVRGAPDTPGIAAKILSPVSDANIEALDWVAGLLADAGFTTGIDFAGNLIARRGGTEAGLLPLMFGSHIDSVPGGGNYDGQVGSMGSVEVATTLAAAGHVTRHQLEIAIFSNEEGGKTGSRALAGELEAFELDIETASGFTIGEGLRRLGGDRTSVV